MVMVMQISTDVSGRSGIDCGGFCKFCFYKNVDFNNLKPIGCVNCPPHTKGCSYCQSIMDRVSSDYKPLYNVLEDLVQKFSKINWSTLNPKDLQILVIGGADIFNYPELYKLVSKLKELPFSLHLGYTSGKPIKNHKMPEKLISLGVDEVSFSIFSTNPEMRRKWMRDTSPDQSIKGFKIFSENIDLNASAVIIPGVNDGEQLIETCVNLEDWGIKSFALRRFANFNYQGLILNKKPILDGITPQTYEEFQSLVYKVSEEFSFKVIGFPLYYSKKDLPFAILKKNNQSMLRELPKIKTKASVLTGKLASPFLKKFFELVDDLNLVNVITLGKEIADLITQEDLELMDLAEVKSNVIIPRGALVHDKEVKKILNSDGKFRKMVRGSLDLTYPYNENVDDSQEDFKKFELKCFKDLIDTINSFK